MTDNDWRALKGIGIVLTMFAAVGGYVLFGESEPKPPSPFGNGGHLTPDQVRLITPDGDEACPESGATTDESCKQHHGSHVHPHKGHGQDHAQADDGVHTQPQKDQQKKAAEPVVHVGERAPPHPVIHVIVP